MTLHPSRTPHHTMKIRNVETGLIIERQPPDAAGMVECGEFEYVPADTPSVKDELEAVDVEGLHTFGLKKGRRFHANQPRDSMVAALTAKVEAGEIMLPEPEAPEAA